MALSSANVVPLGVIGCAQPYSRKTSRSADDDELPIRFTANTQIASRGSIACPAHVVDISEQRERRVVRLLMGGASSELAREGERLLREDDRMNEQADQPTFRELDPIPLVVSTILRSFADAFRGATANDVQFATQ
jgi:hypothetical protein